MVPSLFLTVSLVLLLSLVSGKPVGRMDFVLQISLLAGVPLGILMGMISFFYREKISSYRVLGKIIFPAGFTTLITLTLAMIPTVGSGGMAAAMWLMLYLPPLFISALFGALLAHWHNKAKPLRWIIYTASATVSGAGIFSFFIQQLHQ